MNNLYLIYIFNNLIEDVIDNEIDLNYVNQGKSL